jgi:hypothetical protein
MKRISSLVLGALLLVGAGCAGNPLVGEWQYSQSVGTASFSATYNLAGDGTGTLTAAGSGACTGTQTYQGFTWSSSATTITFTGTPSCTGSISCGGVMVTSCSGASMVQTGACNYQLSNSNNSLTISNCSGGSMMNGATTLTRVMGM